MAKEKVVLLIDDERGFIEALEDALIYEGLKVLTAQTAEQGLAMLAANKVDLVTVDIMMPPGESLEGKVDSQSAGVFVCEQIAAKYPRLPMLCISVVNDREKMNYIMGLGARFIKKGETPLRTVLDLIRSQLTGVAYSTDPRDLRF